MKKSFSLRMLVFAAAVLATLLGSSRSASAYVDVRIGPTPPPAPIVERPWARPYPGAVWIGGHYEWIGGRYSWIGGYYEYPPRRGAHWVGPRYTNRGGAYYYRAGHWR